MGSVVSSPPRSGSRARPAWTTARSPDRWSDGPAAARLIALLTGRRATSWQRDWLDLTLERIDGPGSPFAYDLAVLIVGRRAGKTATSMGVPLFRSWQGPIRLPSGRTVPFRGAHTAQNLVMGRKRFLEDLAEPMVARLSRPERTCTRIMRNISTTTLKVHPRGGDPDAADASQVMVYAPTGTSLRGEGLLHACIDEVMALTAEQGEMLLAATRPTMAEYAGHAQLHLLSNVSMNMEDWLPLLRDRGRAAVDSGRLTGLCYTEFSLPLGADPADEAAWWGCYPALADGLVGIEQLRRDREELGDDIFAAEYLGRWPAENPHRAIGDELWRGARTGEMIPPAAPVVLAVDVDHERRDASIVACHRAGRALVELVEHEPGTGWVVGRLIELVARHHVPAVGVEESGPARSIADELDRAGVPLLRVGQGDYAAACAGFYDGLAPGATAAVRHRGQGDLNRAAAAAVRRAAGAEGWAWGRRASAESITPLVAATLAVWTADHIRQAVAPAIY